jgi:hypothetical protein
MHYLNSIIPVFKKTTLFTFSLLSFAFATAQENSPYSRYGMGDLVPTQNISSRSMGGISAGLVDLSLSQSFNLSNPASLGNLGSTSFDFGLEVDRRTLKSNTNPDKYTANNAVVSYMLIGFPITPKRLVKKGYNWGVAFGLRPATRVNYKIIANRRIPGVDSVNTLYEGSGGINQANFSTGLKYKNFSIGLNTGYSFGNKETSTKLGFINDSITLYQQSNTENTVKFGGLYLSLGTQYNIILKNKSLLRIGATANLQQNLKASQNIVNETFGYDANGTPLTIDSVKTISDQTGTIKLPASYNVGFTYTDENANWMFGADVDITNWTNYSYYGAKDAVQNNFKFHAGVQFYPAKKTTTSNKYWNFVKYRSGFYYGTDYVVLGGKTRPDYGVTFGAGMPLTRFERLRFGDFAILNAGVEIGQRGNKSNVSIRENIVRFNFGLTMSAAWFQKRKYD